MKKFLLLCLLGLSAHSKLDSQTTDILKYDWRARVDSLWGTVPASDELRTFDSLWTLIDQKFACFQNLELDWNAIKIKYRPEIEKGVSRGRFSAILSQMSVALMEPHTRLGDVGVSNVNRGIPGIPILFCGAGGNDRSFGAGLTSLYDSTILVYMSVPSHPFGLVRGDVILGYDGVPWKILYQQLLKMEVPIPLTSYWGGNINAFTHCWLQSAGRNWHLFDTIDIIKYSTKDTLHLPTKLLVGKNLNLHCTEQLPVPGVPSPDSTNGISDGTWGIVQGTNIGYVYSWSWFNSGKNFRNAIDSLTRIYKVDGIVIDLRCNNGGYIGNADDGLSLLFKAVPPPMYLATRNDPLDHFSMRLDQVFGMSVDSTRSYDKPVAVLMGPGSVSANDFIATQIRHRPKTRFFGKSPASGYASSVLFSIGSICTGQYAMSNGYVLEDTIPHYLTHVEFPMDEKVWLTPEGVAKGEDDVAKAALTWIKSLTGVDSRPVVQTLRTFALNQNYPNPCNPTTTISFDLPKMTQVALKVFDCLGREVVTLVEGLRPAGRQNVTFAGSTLSSGVYFYRLQAGDYTAIKKMLLV